MEHNYDHPNILPTYHPSRGTNHQAGHQFIFICILLDSLPRQAKTIGEKETERERDELLSAEFIYKQTGRRIFWEMDTTMSWHALQGMHALHSCSLKLSKKGERERVVQT